VIHLRGNPPTPRTEQARYLCLFARPSAVVFVFASFAAKIIPRERAVKYGYCPPGRMPFGPAVNAAMCISHSSSCESSRSYRRFIRSNVRSVFAGFQQISPPIEAVNYRCASGKQEDVRAARLRSHVMRANVPSTGAQFMVCTAARPHCATGEDACVAGRYTARMLLKYRQIDRRVLGRGQVAKL
jgi:hypothetical protein